jgi:lipopolysaccharide biosynthesis regulator YciM
LACGAAEVAKAQLQAAYERHPGMDLLQAILALETDSAGAAERLARHLSLAPSLPAAAALLKLPPAAWSDAGVAGLRQAVEQAGKPLHRYRCAACGFEAQHYFWQCPGCLSWESYPPLRLDDQ